MSGILFESKILERQSPLCCRTHVLDRPYVKPPLVAVEAQRICRGYSGPESLLPSSPTVYSSEVVEAEKELLHSHNLVAAVACKEDVDHDSRDDECMRDCACMDYCLHGVANSESSASALTADFELDEDEDQDEMG